MALPTNNKNTDKGGKKKPQNPSASKFITKPGKNVTIAKKPVKTGGTRGS